MNEIIVKVFMFIGKYYRLSSQMSIIYPKVLFVFYFHTNYYAEHSQQTR